MVLGIPLLAPEPYTVFLDESGDHSLAKIDPQYPFFGLAGVMTETAAHPVFSRALSKWKTGFFGVDVCLHMREITRNKGAFTILADTAKRARFWTELQNEIDAQAYMLVCSVILKDQHLKQYGAMAYNPYFLTLEFLVERYCHEMRQRNSRAGFVAECRAPHLDAALRAQYVALLANGTHYISAKDLRKYLNPDMQFQPKMPSAIGLQVADLAVGPICRHVGKMKRAQALRVRPHFRQSPDGKVMGWGLKVFP